MVKRKPVNQNYVKKVINNGAQKTKTVNYVKPKRGGYRI